MAALTLRIPRFNPRAGALALCAAAVFAAMPAPPALAQNRLPALGDSASEDFGIGTERKLGDEIMREIRRDPDYLDDPVLLEYVQTMWNALLAAARARGDIGADVDQRFAWEAFLVRDRSVNAFALPGGYVGVHLGLIAMTATRDELASVLAHELTHVTQRHIARSIGNSKRQTLLSTAAMILGVLAASRTHSADMAQAAIAGGQAAAIQGQLNFSRDMEREADRIGLGVMADAGFAPAGMAAMFEKLEHSYRLNDSGGFPYLRSHPLTSERIGEARARLGAATRAAPVSVLEHDLAQARARVLMDTRVDALRHWQALVAGDRAPRGERMAAMYSSALASSLLRDHDRSQASLGMLQALQRSGTKDAHAERAIALLAVQLALAQGDMPRAEAALAPYRDDGSRPVSLLAARLALAGSDAAALKRSADELQTWVAAHAGDAEAWLLASQLWTRLGEPLRSLRAEAEARLALGDLDGAIDRLRAGQRFVRDGKRTDFIEASVIDARLRNIEALRRELQAEARKNGG